MSKKKNYYPSKSVNIDPDVHSAAVIHTQKNGTKLGKFFSIAAKEKMDRDNGIFIRPEFTLTASDVSRVINRRGGLDTGND